MPPILIVSVLQENEECIYVYVRIFLLQPFLRRRKYKLFAAFFSATMIRPADSPVEFEVSVGMNDITYIHTLIHTCTCMHTHTHTKHAHTHIHAIP